MRGSWARKLQEALRAGGRLGVETNRKQNQICLYVWEGVLCVPHAFPDVTFQKDPN